MSINLNSLWALILLLVVMLVPFWRITSKAGFPGALSVLLLVPIANIIYVYYLAFAEWPNLRN